MIEGCGLELRCRAEDVLFLDRSGLVLVDARNNYGGPTSFVIPPESLGYYAELRNRLNDQTDELEHDVHRYLDSPEFRSRFPSAFERWSEAASLLWESETDSELSTIGHKCREAIQEFVTTLLMIHGVDDANPNKAMTRIGSRLS